MSLSNNHHRSDENFIQSYCQDGEKNYIENELKDSLLKIFYAIELWPLRRITNLR
jgi:hypothetical protein